jgi:hypothetical protein
MGAFIVKAIDAFGLTSVHAVGLDGVCVRNVSVDGSSRNNRASRRASRSHSSTARANSRAMAVLRRAEIPQLSRRMAPDCTRRSVGLWMHAMDSAQLSP